MCIAPNLLPNGFLTGCRNCWQCRERKILDWSGRCIAESKVTTACHSLTLTYGRGLDGKNMGEKSHERAAVLTYSDVQKYLKRLRKAGFPCSYFVVGEYGATKGRAHWHMIIFWHGPVPKHELRKNFIEPHWVHGYSFWDTVGPSSVRYVCKYVQKDLDDAEAQGLLRMSKKPPLGSRYFAERAQKYVDQGLAPQDLFYSFPEATDKEGKKLKFMLGGRSAELFLEEYLLRWRGFPPRGFAGPPFPVRGWHYPESELVQEFEDKRLGDVLTAEQIENEIREKNQERKAAQWQREIEETEKALQSAPWLDQRAREYVIRMQAEFLATEQETIS